MIGKTVGIERALSVLADNHIATLAVEPVGVAEIAEAVFRTVDSSVAVADSAVEEASEVEAGLRTVDSGWGAEPGVSFLRVPVWAEGHMSRDLGPVAAVEPLAPEEAAGRSPVGQEAVGIETGIEVADPVEAACPVEVLAEAAPM